jgi:Ca2+-binding RTX toxin-like protein
VNLYGRYVFSDFCKGWVHSVVLGPSGATGLRDEGPTVASPSSFGEDSCGRLYRASLGNHTVYRLVGDAPADCGSAPPPDPDPDPGDPGPGDPPPDPGPGDPPPVTCGGETVTHAVPATGGRFKGTPGKDVIAGSDAADRIVGQGGADLICGGGGNDTLKGGGGADRMWGEAGADDLRGSGGDDRCKGGAGRDILASC